MTSVLKIMKYIYIILIFTLFFNGIRADSYNGKWGRYNFEPYLLKDDPTNEVDRGTVQVVFNNCKYHRTNSTLQNTKNERINSTYIDYDDEDTKLCSALAVPRLLNPADGLPIGVYMTNGAAYPVLRDGRLIFQAICLGRNNCNNFLKDPIGFNVLIRGTFDGICECNGMPVGQFKRQIPLVEGIFMTKIEL